MMESYTFMNYRKFKYLWTIRNFADYFNFVSTQKSHVIRSTMFDIDGHKECQFYLEMILLSNYMSCTFQLKPCAESLKLACQLSILNKDNEKIQTVQVKIFFDNGNYHINDLPQLYMNSSELLKRRLELLPGNNFKVECNLTLYDEDTTVSQILIPRQHQTIKDNLKDLLNSQSGSDVVFEVDGQEFNVHKIILMARSPVFLAMFNSDMVEAKLNRVKIEDIPLSIFGLMIHFIYTDEINAKLDLETGIDLLKAASKYQLEGLEVLCETELYRLLTVKNAMDMLIVAELHNFSNFIQNIRNFVKIRQHIIQSIINPEHFLKHPHHLSLFFPNKNK